MFDAGTRYCLSDRTVDGAHQIYIGVDGRTGKPMLAVPCSMHGLVGARYYDLSDSEYAEAKADIYGWYEKNGTKFTEAAA